MLSYLTAFLNSKIFRFAFKEYFPELLGDTRELSKVFFELISVKIVDPETNQVFDSLLEKITNLKVEERSTKSVEQEIDSMLAEIYSLSQIETKLIDSLESISDTAFPDTINLSELVNS